MNWQALILRGKEVLRFPDGKEAQLNWSYGPADAPVLRVSFEGDRLLELPDAVDVSQALDDPRVFVIEGRRADHVFLFGGKQIYSIGSVGGIERTLRLFREDDLTEYWDTLLFDRQDTLLVVYESGVLVLDDLFHVRFHQKKLINDVLANLEKNRLMFVRDHETEWYLDLSGGTAEEERSRIS